MCCITSLGFRSVILHEYTRGDNNLIAIVIIYKNPNNYGSEWNPSVGGAIFPKWIHDP